MRRGAALSRPSAALFAIATLEARGEERLLTSAGVRPAEPGCRRSRAGGAALAAAAWLIAALLEGGIGPVIAQRLGPAAGVAFKVAALLAVSGLLMGLLRVRRLAPSRWYGPGWLVLAIVAEMVASAWVRAGWSELLGPAAVPWAHDVLTLSWLGAPALFLPRAAA